MESLAKSINFFRASSIGGASSTISFVIFVSSWTSYGMSILGLTKVENLSFICPSSSKTAPISVILSPVTENPVVSISKTTSVRYSAFMMHVH